MTLTAEPPASPSPPATADGAVVRTRSPRPLRWIALGLAVVAIAFLLVLATRKSAEQSASDSPLLGKPAPEVIGPGIDGSTVRLSQLRGRYVVLNFFASWCVPCAREHDDLLRFQEAHREAGDATVLAVTFNNELEDARGFFEERGGDWPVVADDRGKVSLDFGVRGPPESFLISPEGIVLTRIIGEVRYEGLESLIEQAKALRR